MHTAVDSVQSLRETLCLRPLLANQEPALFHS